MNQILMFLSAGSFVYLAFQCKDAFGNGVYWALVGLALGMGYILGWLK